MYMIIIVLVFWGFEVWAHRLMFIPHMILTTAMKLLSQLELFTWVYNLNFKFPIPQEWQPVAGFCQLPGVDVEDLRALWRHIYLQLFYLLLLQTLQGQLKSAKAGRPVDESEIPPEVFVPKPSVAASGTPPSTQTSQPATLPATQPTIQPEIQPTIQPTIKPRTE